MDKTLQEIAEIRTGIFAKPELNGEVFYLHARHFDEDGEFDGGIQPDLKLDGLTAKHLLKPGDVLFAAKGSKNFAAVYQSEFSAVASTTFFIITRREANILPEYLAWVLNGSRSQAFFRQEALGSDIPSISKKALGKLKLAIPSVEKQKQILEIERLSKMEQDLRVKIAQLRQHLIQSEITNAIK